MTQKDFKDLIAKSKKIGFYGAVYKEGRVDRIKKWIDNNKQPMEYDRTFNRFKGNNDVVFNMEDGKTSTLGLTNVL